MTVQIWRLVKGDEEPVVRVRVQDEDGLAVDCTDIDAGGMVELEHGTDGTTWATLTGGGIIEQVADTDAAARTAIGNTDTPQQYWEAEYQFQAGDTDSFGEELARFKLTRSGGNVLHSPSSPPWLLVIGYD